MDTLRMQKFEKDLASAPVPKLRNIRLIAFVCSIAFSWGAEGASAAPSRADAILTAQMLAAEIEPVLRPLPDVAQLLGGDSARAQTEYAIAELGTAFAAYPLADAYWQKLQTDAEYAHDDQLLGIALIARIEAALNAGDYVLGEQATNQLQTLARVSSNRMLLAAAHEYQGVLDRRRGSIDSAMTEEQLALDLQRQSGDAAGEARALTNLGTIARDRGDFAHSLDFHLQALAISERLNLRLETVYRNLALLYRELGDDHATQDYFDKALAAAERYAEPGYYAGVLGTYASFLNDTGRYERALAMAGESLAISKVINNTPSVGFEQLEAGRALLGLHRNDEAQTYFERALETGNAIKQREIIVRSELQLAENALQSGNQRQAHVLLDDVLQNLGAAQMKPQLAQAYALRDRLAETENDVVTAHDFAHRYMNLREELLGVRSTRQLAAVEARSEHEQATRELELAARTNELQAERLDRARTERMFGAGAIALLLGLLVLGISLFLRLRHAHAALAERTREIEMQRETLTTTNTLLEQKAAALHHAAITDPLTGVGNRAYLLDRLGAMFSASQSDGSELSVMMIDFDHFKQVNDHYGHLGGDRMLIEAVQCIQSQLDEDGLIGRFGGEEFIVALQGRNVAASRQLAERIRIAVAERMAEMMPRMNPVPTVSIGFALLSQIGAQPTLNALIDAADAALYSAKVAGRNQVRGAHLS